MGNNTTKKKVVWACPGCIAIRDFKWEEGNIFSCPICGLKIECKNGSITVIRSSMTKKGAG